MTNDKRSTADPGSIDNPLGPSPEEAASKWRQKIDPEKHNMDLLNSDLSKMLPVLEIAEKLANHTSSIMMAIQLMKKQEAAPEKLKALLERVRSVLALKEDLDIYLSERCAFILDELEDEHGRYEST